MLEQSKLTAKERQGSKETAEMRGEENIRMAEDSRRCVECYEIGMEKMEGFESGICRELRGGLEVRLVTMTVCCC
jgi:hypothetical protein